MGCIKSKEVVHLDAISQQNVDNSPPIKTNKKETNIKGSSINYLSENQMNLQKENNHENVNVTNHNRISGKTNVKVTDVYQTITNLSKREKCSWYKVKKIGDDVFNAMKVVEVQDVIDISQFPMSIEKIINLNHESLVDVVNYFQDENKVYIITEFISGGELFEYVLNKYYLSGRAIRYSIIQLLNVFEYLHKNEIFSNYLSIKNIHVFNKKDDELLDIKITNYFRSTLFKRVPAKEKLGTYFNQTLQRNVDYYTPPEILNKKTDIDYKKAEIWSIGIIMYILVSGNSPFEGECQDDINNEILKKKINIEQLKQLSTEGRDFLSKLLERNINERFTIEECLSHKWIQTHYQVGLINNELKVPDKYVEATNYYVNSKNNSISKLKEIFPDKQTQFSKSHIIKSIEQYESKDDGNQGMKRKLLECLTSYESDLFTLKDYLSFVDQMVGTKGKKEKEKETDANSGKGESRKSSLMKGNENNSDSEDSFVIYSEEKIANEFDREKFLRLIENANSDISDVDYNESIVQVKDSKKRKKM
jgi:serine/threonine protein kinase